jgi:hypothetical protein
MISKRQSLLIHFDAIEVEFIQSSSGIFVGTNTQLRWSAHRKTNDGFGTVSGDGNIMHHNVNVVNDGDWIDAPISGGDFVLKTRP